MRQNIIWKQYRINARKIVFRWLIWALFLCSLHRKRMEGCYAHEHRKKTWAANDLERFAHEKVEESHTLSKKWIMEKVHRQYTQFVEKNHRIPHRADRRILIENLCCQIYSRGIMIYKGEVVRVVDHRMRKWNRRYLKREMEVAQETMLQKENETAE